jgi:hypothetical protein
MEAVQAIELDWWYQTLLDPVEIQLSGARNELTVDGLVSHSYAVPPL